MSVAISCNARFKEGYGRCILHSLLAAAAVHILLLGFTPPFEFEPYRLADEGGVCTLFVAPPLDLPPEPIARPEPSGPPPVIDPVESGVDERPVDIPPNFGALGGAAQPVNPVGETAMPFTPSYELPALLSAVNPDYPELARLAGIEGRVSLRLVVGADGKVRSATVISSDVLPAMERAAVAAALQYRFVPAMQGSTPVEVQVEVPIVFRLH